MFINLSRSKAVKKARSDTAEKSKYTLMEKT